jgi:predicted TIM-barrel fold metal-dependent hydrolase
MPTKPDSNQNNSTRIIDSHQHVFWHGRDDAGLIADMDEHGVELAWLLTWEISPGEDLPSVHGLLNPLNFRTDGTHAGIPLVDLLRARDRYPDRFVLGYCPHPMMCDAAAAFQAAVDMYGVRVCGEWKFRIPLDDPRSLELFRTAAKNNCPVVLHLDDPYLFSADTNRREYYADWYGGGIDVLERVLIRCPDTHFIGHAPGFWRHISGGADHEPGLYPDSPVQPGGRLFDLFERYPNLSADLSAQSAILALQRDPTLSKSLIAQYPDRFLFGRDYYGGQLQALLMDLQLPDAVMGQILRTNAEALLRKA